MIGQTVGELLEEKVTLDVEGIDRLYLNLYQPRLQTGAGVAAFFKQHRGAKVASTALMGPMSHAFVKSIHDFAKREGVEIVPFAKGERKDEVTKKRLAGFSAPEGVLYIGKAQEKFASFRVSKKFSERTGKAFPWLSRGAVMCNHYYFYLVDEDFGPLFIKFASYFPCPPRGCASMAMNTPSGSWRRKGSPSRRWTTGSSPVPIRCLCNRFSMSWTPPRSRRWWRNGSRACPTLSAPKTTPPALLPSCPSCKRNSPAPRSWTVP